MELINTELYFHFIDVDSEQIQIRLTKKLKTTAVKSTKSNYFSTLLILYFSCIILKITNNLVGGGRGRQMFFQRTWVLLLVPTYQLTATCGSCSRRFDPPLLASTGAAYTQGKLTSRQICTHIK